MFGYIFIWSKSKFKKKEEFNPSIFIILISQLLNFSNTLLSKILLINKILFGSIISSKL